MSMSCSKGAETSTYYVCLSLLVETGIDHKDLRIINNIYYNQTANIKWPTNEERQGCILSPMLFNVSSEGIFMQALKEN